jgi:hypothetical protein
VKEEIRTEFCCGSHERWYVVLFERHSSADFFAQVVTAIKVIQQKLLLLTSHHN